MWKIRWKLWEKSGKKVENHVGKRNFLWKTLWKMWTIPQNQNVEIVET